MISDLVGLNVFDTNGNQIGIICDLGENKATDLLQIQKANGLKFLVPFVKDWVQIVDIENKKIVINMRDGIDTTNEKQGSSHEV